MSKIEYCKALVNYPVGTIILDDATNETFEVLESSKLGENSFKIKMKSVSNKTYKIDASIKELVSCLEDVKMHDKDLFMILNMVSSLEDIINE